MSLETEKPSTKANITGYRVNQTVPIKFLSSTEFRSYLKEYLQKLLSTEIEITWQHFQKKKKRFHTTASSGYMIRLLGTHENKAEMEQTMSNFCENYFKAIKSKIFNDDKVIQWLTHCTLRGKIVQCIQNIMDQRVQKYFTVCELVKSSLKVYYLTKEPFKELDSEQIDQIIQNEICQKMILLPISYEDLGQLRSEIRNMEWELLGNSDVFIDFVSGNSSVIKSQHKSIVFGYYKNVNQLEKQILKMSQEYSRTTIKVDIIEPFQLEYFRRNCPDELNDMKTNYLDGTVEIRIKPNEFSTSQDFKEQIESRIKQVLSQAPVKKFNSKELPKDIAQLAEKHLHHLAQRSHFYVKTELSYKARHYPIPKALLSTNEVSKSIIEQSNQFCCSSDVFNRINIANGSIEVRTGDVTQQKVDTIVISSSPDGLKECVIERAIPFRYEKTYTDITGIKFTETDGGNLNCKRILFSNWMPTTNSNDDDELRKSIQFFISKSIEYAIKDQNSTSVAFAIPAACTQEKIFAEELIGEAKRQLESNDLQIRISFILLSEQQRLLNELFSVMSFMQGVYAQLEWPTAIIKIIRIVTPDDDDDDEDNSYFKRFQKQIDNYINRSISSLKLSNTEGIFQNWDQYTINAFYKYCKNKCVLPQINKTKTELELTGPISCIYEAKRNWYLVSELSKEKVSGSSTSERSVGRQTKLVRIMISYSERDSKSCQRLIDRLLGEGFLLWAKPATTEQERDVSSKIDQADCSILCVSENFYEHRSCEKEARYAFQIGKPVFLVNIRNDSLIGWQREVFADKLFFQLFGSDNNFNLECSRLSLEIMRRTKPSYMPAHESQNNDEYPSMTTIEYRRSKYEKKIRALKKIGHINEEDMQTLVKQLQDVLTDGGVDISKLNDQTDTNNKSHSIYQSTPSWFERIKMWVKNPTNLTKQNLPPFSVTGDINDAPFPMPTFIMNLLNPHVPSLSLTPFAPLKLKNLFECDIVKRSAEQPFPRLLFNPTFLDDECIYGICTQKRVPFKHSSQVSLEKYHTTDSNPEKTMKLPVLSPEVLLVNEKKKHKHRKSNKPKETNEISEEVSRNPIKKKYKHPTRKELNVYFERFARIMQQNTIEFEKFCAKPSTKHVGKRK